MLTNKHIKRLLYIVSTILLLLVIILSVPWIQREIKWKNNRKEMLIIERDLRQKIYITQNERFPVEIEQLYSSIINDETELQNQYIPFFDALTVEFIKRINEQMNTSLSPDDIKSVCSEKSSLELYKDDQPIARYEFTVGEETFMYEYYSNMEVYKTIFKGTKRINLVGILNENNENSLSIYSEWKNKYDAYGGEPYSIR